MRVNITSWPSSGSKIFLSRNFNGEWKYAATLPFETDSGQLYLLHDHTVVFLRNDDSVFYFNMLTSKLTHHFADKLVYDFKDGSFQLEDPVLPSSDHKWQLPENDDEIESPVVEDFAKQLPRIINWNSTIQELEFTDKEYERCRQDRREFQKSVEEKKRKKKLSFQFSQNNIDFTRLISMVDSVKEIDSTTLNKYLLSLNEILSTTTNWTKVSLKNNNGDELEIESYYYEPNAFYFPWHISLNGITITSTNIAINHFIEKVYPSLLDNKGKVEILHALVKKLY